jgi:DNA polymerase III subunit epsilon
MAMSEVNNRNWITRLLNLGLRPNQISSAYGQTGTFQQEAYIRQLLKDTHQRRLDLGTPIKDITFIILDTETTGFEVEKDAIFSLSATKTKAGKPTASYSTLIHPDCLIPEPISRLTGISSEDVEHAPYLSEVIQTILNFLADGVLLGYHITHDLSFLNHYLLNQNYRKLPHQSFELRQLMERVYDQHFLTLDDALNFLTIPCNNRHTADGDVQAMVHLWACLLEKLEDLKLTTLYDLYAFLAG